MLKRCAKCKEDKPSHCFTINLKYKTGLSSYCKPCNSICTNEYNKRNRAKRRIYEKEYKRARKDYMRNSHLQRSYGINAEQYNTMYQQQNGCCAICEAPKLVLNVDHDHNTGKIRKLLCHLCNTALGLFQDSHKILEAATKYLAEQEFR